MPHRFRNTELEYRLTDAAVEFIHNGVIIAFHDRLKVEGGISTNPEHQPPNHKAVSGWTADQAIAWATEIGESTAKMLAIQLDRSPNFMSGYRTTEGMKSLCKKYGGPRVENVCRYALANKATSMEEVRTILSKNLEALLPNGVSNTAPEIKHENIRGADYYARILSDSKGEEYDE